MPNPDPVRLPAEVAHEFAEKFPQMLRYGTLIPRLNLLLRRYGWQLNRIEKEQPTSE